MLRQRVITAVVLMLSLIAVAGLASPFYFALCLALVVMLAAGEWCRFIGLTDNKDRTGYLLTVAIMLTGLFLLLGVRPDSQSMDSLRAAVILVLGLAYWIYALRLLQGYPGNRASWNDRSKIAVMSLFVLAPAWVGLVQLKYLAPFGVLVVALVVMVAAVDIGGFFVGRRFGHTALAPSLSPNKTWEGVWGGLVACLLLGIALIAACHRFLAALTPMQMAALVLLSLSITMLDVIGDLSESMFKRNRNIKDSGRLLPGHGGIMDRVDGLVAVIPVFTLAFLAILGGAE